MNTPPRLLIIDDEEMALANLSHILKKQGYEIVPAESGPKGLELVRSEAFDLILTDLRMEKVDGMKILEEAQQLHPNTEVVMITGYATVDSAIEAMKKRGVSLHIQAVPYRRSPQGRSRGPGKDPSSRGECSAQGRPEKDSRGRRNAHNYQRSVSDENSQDRKTGCSDRLQQSSSAANRGTGKELLARYIHEHSERKEGPFMAVNCGVFTEDLLSNELFRAR